MEKKLKEKELKQSAHKMLIHFFTGLILAFGGALIISRSPLNIGVAQLFFFVYLEMALFWYMSMEYNNYMEIEKRC